MGYTKPMPHICQNLHTWAQVWVLMGVGTGCPGQPQGSLQHSLSDTQESYLTTPRLSEPVKHLFDALLEWNSNPAILEEQLKPELIKVNPDTTESSTDNV